MAELRDTVRFWCDICSVLPTQDKRHTPDIVLVSDAIRRVSFWEQELQHIVTQQDNENQNASKGTDRGNSNERPTKTTPESSDGHAMCLFSESTDDQPMDICCDSSDDDGGIIHGKKENVPSLPPKHQNLPGAATYHSSQHGDAIIAPLPTNTARSQPATSRSNPAAPHSLLPGKKKNKKGKIQRAKAKKAKERKAHQLASGTAVPDVQTQPGPRPVGSLLPHPSLPARPPTPSSWDQLP